MKGITVSIAFILVAVSAFILAGSIIVNVAVTISKGEELNLTKILNNVQ